MWRVKLCLLSEKLRKLVVESRGEERLLVFDMSLSHACWVVKLDCCFLRKILIGLMAQFGRDSLLWFRGSFHVVALSE